MQEQTSKNVTGKAENRINAHEKNNLRKKHDVPDSKIIVVHSYLNFIC